MDACCLWPFLLLLSLLNLAEVFGGSSGEGYQRAHRGPAYPPTVGQKVAYWCLAALAVAFAAELVVFVAFFL